MACERDQESTLKTQLTVNGQEIELTSFVQDFIGRAVIGMVASLKGVDEIQAVTLNIEQPAKP